MTFILTVLFLIYIRFLVTSDVLNAATQTLLQLKKEPSAVSVSRAT